MAVAGNEQPRSSTRCRKGSCSRALLGCDLESPGEGGVEQPGDPEARHTSHVTPAQSSVPVSPPKGEREADHSAEDLGGCVCVCGCL